MGGGAMCTSMADSCWCMAEAKQYCKAISFSLLLLLFSCSVVSDSLHPNDCGTPGFSVLYHLSEFAQTHVHWVMPSNPSHPLSSLLLPSIFHSIRPLPVSRLFPSAGQSIGASASASVLPMNIQGWFPGLTDFLSLLSKGLLGIFSITAIQKTSILWCSAFFMVQLSHASFTKHFIQWGCLPVFMDSFKTQIILYLTSF